jgi:hypothetical protein
MSDNLNDQHKDKKAIDGALDNKTIDTVAGRYAERVDMYKYNLKSIVGIEVAEQEVEM